MTPRNEPAFPSTEEVALTDKHGHVLHHTEVQHPGMTLRDWFAGMVLPACYADAHDLESAADEAYRLADLMLAQRERKDK